MLFVLFLFARRLVHSPFGLSLQGDPRQPAARRRARRAGRRGGWSAIYTLSAAYAGMAGALLAQTTQFVSLDVLDFHRSADVLLVLVIGGAGYLYGGLIGAVLFTLPAGLDLRPDAAILDVLDRRCSWSLLVLVGRDRHACRRAPARSPRLPAARCGGGR